MKSLVGKVHDNNLLLEFANMFDAGGYCYTNEVIGEYFSNWLEIQKSSFQYYTACFEPWFMAGDIRYNVGEIYKSDDFYPTYFLVFKVVDAFVFTIKFER